MKKDFSIMFMAEEDIRKGDAVEVNHETGKLRKARFGGMEIEIDPELLPNEWQLKAKQERDLALYIKKRKSYDKCGRP